MCRVLYPDQSMLRFRWPKAYTEPRRRQLQARAQTRQLHQAASEPQHVHPTESKALSMSEPRDLLSISAAEQSHVVEGTLFAASYLTVRCLGRQEYSTEQSEAVLESVRRSEERASKQRAREIQRVSQTRETWSVPLKEGISGS